MQPMISKKITDFKNNQMKLIKLKSCVNFSFNKKIVLCHKITWYNNRTSFKEEAILYVN